MFLYFSKEEIKTDLPNHHNVLQKSILFLNNLNFLEQSFFCIRLTFFKIAVTSAINESTDYWPLKAQWTGRLSQCHGCMICMIEIRSIKGTHALDVIYHPEDKEYGAFCNLKTGFYSVCAVQVHLLR